MTMPGIRRFFRFGSAVLILAGFLGAGSLANAATSKTTAAAKPAPAARPAPAAKPSGAAGATHAGGTSAGSHGTTGGASANHGPSANGAAHGPSANGSHGPTANGPANAHGASAATANGHGGPSAANKPSGPIGRAAPKGSVDHLANNGSAVRTRPNGRVSDVHDAKRGMDVHNGLNGNRRVSVEHADHSRFVSERGRPGYAQHPYSFHGHDFGRRSYFYHGHAYSRFYRGHYYRGVYMNVYAPDFYYRPAFYGWAYNPWGMPVSYGWGWGASPWYGYYGYYFAPSPVYPSASAWLTDYMISSDLQASYAAHQDAGEIDGAPPVAGAAGGPALTPEVKQQIADEVRAQLALENQESTNNTQGQDADPVSSGIGRMVGDGRAHVFVAGSDLDVVDAAGQECMISDGDALQMQTPPASDAIAADLVVLSSKGGQECQKAATVTISLNDLQEMQNHMRETIDQGLKELQASQGKGGLPTLPPSAQGAAVPAVYVADAPPSDPNIATEIQQQAQLADQAQNEVASEVAGNGGAPPVASAAAASVSTVPPASVEVGQTVEQVKSELGAPTRVANLGPKSIYYYNGMKVIFKDGKVSDVQ